MRLFQKTVKEVLTPFRKNGIDYCVIGGLAVISTGIRRGTMDFEKEK